MPRQLPWKRNSGGSRPQKVKPLAHPSKSTEVPDDIDDDFFDGTVRASASKGRSERNIASDMEDSLPELLGGPATGKTSRKDIAKERAPSSSPPPLVEYPVPHSESMRKGVSKFDLRDDEWMMVEDEFLETAKLFTRHLHIAEYERLKANIEAKKKEAEIPRPVIAGAKRSVEGVLKERARVQDNKQKKAIRDVFASQEGLNGDNTPSYQSRPSKTITTIPMPATNISLDTDSDDLDAPGPAKRKARALESLDSARNLLTEKEPPPASTHVSKSSTSSFVKPALPTPTTLARPRARASRMTPFDMLDEYVTPTFDTRTLPAAAPGENQTSVWSKPRSQSTSSGQFSPQIPQTTSTKAAEPRKSVDLLDDLAASGKDGEVSDEVAARIAKRRIERANEGKGEEKRRATNLADIPTFLF